MQRLRKEAPDLADQVVDEKLPDVAAFLEWLIEVIDNPAITRGDFSS
jgi:hypothetical protein